METTISKLQAADALLDAAADALLDRSEYVAAIVLAGSAEDLLHDRLEKSGRLEESARGQLISHIRDFGEVIQPGGPRMSDNTGANVIRWVFNWLRHDNKAKDDPYTVELNLASEAVMAVERAIENRKAIDGHEHPRTQDVVNLERALSSDSGVPG